MAELQVLILDDDPMVGGLIELVAQLAGAQTCRVELPDAFFASLEASPPTHVVLDMRMPEMSGEAVLAELARRQCSARIILTSGDPGEAEAARLACDPSLHIAGVLAKPFAPSALRALLA